MKTLILDTETISVSEPFTHNVGWCVLDFETGEILKNRDFLIKEIYNDKPLMRRCFFKGNLGFYEQARTPCVRFKKAIRLLRHDLKKYKCSCIWAFNAPFDERALRETGEKLNVRSTFLMSDILKSAKQWINANEKRALQYEAFCVRNNFLTSTGKTSFTAEKVFAFLMGKPEFKEAHTALADAFIEASILSVVGEGA